MQTKSSEEATGDIESLKSDTQQGIELATKEGVELVKEGAGKEELQPMPVGRDRKNGGDSGASASSTTSEFKNLTRPKVVFLALLFAGSQLIQELLTEAIFTKYHTDRLTYETAMLYSCFQQVGTVVVALVVMTFNHVSSSEDDKNQGRRVAPSWLVMLFLALLVFASTALPNWAMEFVYFPAKVVAKSTKLVPTMIVSVIMGNSKKFTAIDYVAAVLLCSGSVAFALNSGRVDVDDNGVETVKENVWFGLALLTISALADALVPNLQQVTMRAGASAEQVALRVNLVGAAWIAIFLLISGALKEWFFGIFWEQPMLFALMMSGSATLGVAVLAYTMLIREAGSVVAVAIATARKVLTLTLSYVVFPGEGKTFGMSHAVSAFAVALGMALGPLYERYKAFRRGAEPEYSRI